VARSLTANANAINIVGKATTYNAVSNLYDNLRASGQFSDVVLGKTTEIAEGVSFSLTCRYAPPARRRRADPGAPAAPQPPRASGK
jgi:Tfp pilus assembly protein PilN